MRKYLTNKVISAVKPSVPKTKLSKAKTPKEQMIAIAKVKNLHEQNGLEVSKDVLTLEAKLNKQGYKSIDLIGKQFTDEMTVIVESFEVDETGTIPEGEEYITFVVKAGVSKDGKLISAPKVIVTKGVRKTLSVWLCGPRLR